MGCFFVGTSVITDIYIARISECVNHAAKTKNARVLMKIGRKEKEMRNHKTDETKRVETSRNAISYFGAAKYRATVAFTFESISDLKPSFTERKTHEWIALNAEELLVQSRIREKPALMIQLNSR